MKILLNGKLFEYGIVRIGFNNPKCTFVCYNTNKIDLVLELDKLGISWEHVAYSSNNREISVWLDLTKDSIYICDEDSVKATSVYAFMYTSCIFESAYYPISLHSTKKEAFKAMNKFLNTEWYNGYDTFLIHDKGCDRKDKKTYPSIPLNVFKVGVNEGWYIKEIKIE